MFLDFFTCISVIFEAINFVRWAYESLDFEDSENIWFFLKNIDLAWEPAKIKKVVGNPVVAELHRKMKKYQWKWKFFKKRFADLNSARKNASIEKKSVVVSMETAESSQDTLQNFRW